MFTTNKYRGTLHAIMMRCMAGGARVDVTRDGVEVVEFKFESWSHFNLISATSIHIGIVTFHLN